jgi:hypothetical protein
MEDVMSELLPEQIKSLHPGNGCPAEDGEYLAKLARAMRRALKRAVDYAMRHDDAAKAANEALEILRAELLWRFELLRSGPRKPIPIVPEPIPPFTVNTLSVERRTKPDDVTPQGDLTHVAARINTSQA